MLSIRHIGPLTDPEALRALPPAMPKAVVQGLAGVAAPDRAGSVHAATENQADPMPLTYTSVTDLTGWVDSETGVTVDLKSVQGITATTLAGGAGVELFPVMGLTMTTTPVSRAELADTAEDGARALWLLGDVAPLATFALALVLVALAIVLERRARRPRVEPTLPGPRAEADDVPSTTDDTGRISSP